MNIQKDGQVAWLALIVSLVLRPAVAEDFTNAIQAYLQLCVSGLRLVVGSG